MYAYYYPPGLYMVRQRRTAHRLCITNIIVIHSMFLQRLVCYVISYV